MQTFKFSLVILFLLGFQSISAQENMLRIAETADTLERIEAYLNLSSYNRDRIPQKALEYAGEALKMSEMSGNDSLHATSLLSMGYANYHLNQYEQALDFFFRAESAFDAIGDRTHVAICLNRQGNTYQLMGDNRKALIHYERALAVNNELKDTLEIARTLTNLGSAYRVFGSYERAIQVQLEALSLQEKAGNREGFAWTGVNIARLFRMMQNYEKALEYIHKSLEIYRELESDDGLQTGTTLCMKEMGVIYNEMGQLDSAIRLTQKVLELNRKNGNEYGIGNAYQSLGEIYFKKGDYSKAYSFLERSEKIKIRLDDYTGLASVYRHMGRIHLMQRNYNSAERMLMKSRDIAQNQQRKEDVKETYRALADMYEQEGQAFPALDYYKEYIRLKDSLQNQQISEMEMQYAFDRQQEKQEYQRKQREAEQQARLERQRLYTYFAIFAFIFTLLLVVVIYRSYRRKKAINKVLVQQKEEIEAQRDEIEAQRDTATQQRDQIAKQKTIITDSIEYARRIQTAALPQQRFLQQLIPENFVLYLPKNIVSGDFYWVEEHKDKIYIAVADCTGHGVPGAFMSMLGIAFLNQIAGGRKERSASEILELMRENVIDSLHQEYGLKGSKDGMDMVLCILDKDRKHVQYAGAYNPLYIVRQGELLEYKADKMPIGIHAVKVDKTFTNKEIDLETGDMLYMFSDGYVDQFGGEEGQKFRHRPYKELLMSIADREMAEQKEILKETYNKWKGAYKQLDDILVMGVRV